jgi:hypothetical protein
MNPNPPAVRGPITTIDVGDVAGALAARAVAPALVIRCPPGVRFRHAARRLGHHLRLATGCVATVRVAVAPPETLTQTAAPAGTDVDLAVALAVAVRCTAPDDLSNTEAAGLCWYAVTGCAACTRVASDLLTAYAE